MCSDAVIQVRGLSKTYRIYNRPVDRVLESVFHRSGLVNYGNRFREVEALKPLDLDIGRGQTVGIIGRNGSGKSTLLQIISGTLYPSSGEVRVNGRLAALLELGAGFNPEFTGRENAWLNASIMGIPRSEMQRRFDEIVAFSGIGDFIDQPVKTYSSGMYVRLAFAVAIHMDPDVLIVDEALSVGDVSFQNQCYRKLREMRERGTTTLFVTHSSELVIRHCDSAILLEQGRVLSQGEPSDVVNDYLNMLYSTQGEIRDRELPQPAELSYDDNGLLADHAVDGCRLRASYNRGEYRWGDRRGVIQDFRLAVNGEAGSGVCHSGDHIELLVRYVFRETVQRPIYGLTIKTADGITVYGANTRDRRHAVAAAAAGSEVLMRFTFTARLIGGDYFISLGLADDDELRDNVAIDRRYDMIHLHVAAEGMDFGITDMDLQMQRLNGEVGGKQ